MANNKDNKTTPLKPINESTEFPTLQKVPPMPKVKTPKSEKAKE